MKRYTLLFSLAYLAASLVIYLLLNLVGDHLPAQAGSVLNLLAAIGASIFAAHRFVGERQRAATPAEARSFGRQALLGVWLAVFLMFLVMLEFFLTPDQATALLLVFSVRLILIITGVSILAFSFIYYLSIRWSFYWYARRLGGS